jgi:hypothetical protein
MFDKIFLKNQKFPSFEYLSIIHIRYKFSAVLVYNGVLRLIADTLENSSTENPDTFAKQTLQVHILNKLFTE